MIIQFLGVWTSLGVGILAMMPYAYQFKSRRAYYIFVFAIGPIGWIAFAYIKLDRWMSHAKSRQKKRPRRH